jgi:hypothetical protein
VGLSFVALLLFFGWVYRRQKRIESEAASRQVWSDSEMVRLAMVETARHKEWHAELQMLERRLDDAIDSQNKDILSLSLNASAEEQAQFLNQQYARAVRLRAMDDDTPN